MKKQDEICFIIDRIFPAENGVRRITLEINGCVIDRITTTQNPKAVMRGMRIEHGLKYKHIEEAWR